MGHLIRELFSPPYYPALSGIGWTIFMLLLLAFSKRRGKKVVEVKPKDPDVQFLESALEEDSPRKPNPNYSYAEFRRDLFDRGLTFDEIYEKCGGVFPKEPEEGQFGPQGHQGYAHHGLDGVDVYPPMGMQGAQGSQGYQGPDGGRDQSPRMKELQDWFKDQAKVTGVGQIVPPPPNPYPIIHKIYIRGRR